MSIAYNEHCIYKPEKLHDGLIIYSVSLSYSVKNVNIALHNMLIYPEKLDDGDSFSSIKTVNIAKITQTS
jgi:hypothetical protein